MKGHQLDDLNRMEAADFVHALSEVYEHSPWVIDAVARMRPFHSPVELQVACESVLYGAATERQIDLIQAHPDLAAKLDHLPKLTDFSQAEQARAGFSALPPEELDGLRTALAAYRERFNHPFILCVTEHSASAVLPIIRIRTQSDRDSERLACLFQIARIGWYRICKLIDSTA